MPATMRAGRLNIGTGTFMVRDIPVPEPGHGQVRVKIKAAGVCLSDVHLIRGHGKPLFLQGDEVTMGHENAGVVDGVGNGVTGWAPGERVAVFAGQERGGIVLTMGVDFDGGWAEYLVVRAENLLRLPDSISFEQACILGDAVGTPWSAIESTAEFRAGMGVGVWGLGGLGSHAIQLLRFAGAAPIIAIDPLEAARVRAVERGADVVLDPTAPDFDAQLLAASDGRGVDVALDFAGHPAVQAQALRGLAVGGKLVVVGISGKPLTVEDSFGLTLKKQQVRGHYASEFRHLQDIVRLVDVGRLNFASSVTATYPLEDAVLAVDRLESKEGNPIRLVLIP